MEVIKIAATQDTPNVILDANNGIFEISGKSLPEDVNSFYGPIVNWLDEYSKSPNDKTVFDFKLDYINTASSKYLFTIFLKLEKLYEAGHDVLIRWHFAEDDEDMEDVGHEFDDVIKLPFEHLPYSVD
ncbi:MAG: hypothetical protein Kow0068_22730 [Marinilabiliales bacterium]